MLYPEEKAGTERFWSPTCNSFLIFLVSCFDKLQYSDKRPVTYLLHISNFDFLCSFVSQSSIVIFLLTYLWSISFFWGLWQTLIQLGYWKWPNISVWNASSWRKSYSSSLYIFLFRMLSVTKEAFDPPVRGSFLFCLLIFADNFIIYSSICHFSHVVCRSW